MRYNVAEFIGSIQDGGAETLVKDYALLLDKDKFNVVIILLRRYYDTANDSILAKNGIKMISIYKNSSFPFMVIQKLNYWWYVPYRLIKIIRQENLDVIHVHLAFLKYFKRISRFITGIKLFYTCHSCPQSFFAGVNWKEKSAAKVLIKNNNLQIVALHSDMCAELNDMFGIDNTVFIRNAIDFRRFKYVLESKEEIRKAIGVPPNAFIVGNIGRLSAEKNQGFLVEIFDELCKRQKNSFLLMVGAGKKRRSIEKKLNRLGLEGKYKILSHRSDIPQLLKAMDVFVFTPIYEGLGIVLIEAQISGLRCIVSDTVPQEAFQTELAVPVSLNETPSKWCDIILDPSIKGKENGNIGDYDMNQEIKRLESLYLGEFNG